MSDYKIIRTPGNMVDLEVRVRAEMGSGYVPTGAPWRDSESRQWCQAMFLDGKPEPMIPPEARLREPEKTIARRK